MLDAAWIRLSSRHIHQISHMMRTKLPSTFFQWHFGINKIEMEDGTLCFVSTIHENNSIKEIRLGNLATVFSALKELANALMNLIQMCRLKPCQSTFSKCSSNDSFRFFLIRASRTNKHYLLKKGEHFFLCVPQSRNLITNDCFIQVKICVGHVLHFVGTVIEVAFPL